MIVAPESPPASKLCRGCQESLPLSSFHVDRRNPDGRTVRCKECVKKQAKARQEIVAMFEAAYQRLQGIGLGV
jgi:hypothetical protein